MDDWNERMRLRIASCSMYGCGLSFWALCLSIHPLHSFPFPIIRLPNFFHLFFKIKLFGAWYCGPSWQIAPCGYKSISLSCLDHCNYTLGLAITQNVAVGKQKKIYQSLPAGWIGMDGLFWFGSAFRSIMRFWQWSLPRQSLSTTTTSFLGHWAHHLPFSSWTPPGVTSSRQF